MASYAPQPLHPVDSEQPTNASASHGQRLAAVDEATDAEPAQHDTRASRSTPCQQRAFRLVEASPPVAAIIGGTVAVLMGGAVGYLLGARRTQRPARTVRRAASRAEHAVELLPVAMQLLANPVVRALVLRMVMRRLAL